MPKISGPRAKPVSSSKASDTKGKAKPKTETPAKPKTGWGPAVSTGGSESGRSSASTYSPPSYSSGGGE